MSYFIVFLIAVYTIVLSIPALVFALVERSYTIYFLISKLYSRGVLLISGVKLKIIGLENFDHNKVYVYVSNHSSMFDIPALQAAFPNHAGIVFKKELVKIPIFGWQLYVGPYVVIDRENPEKALKSIKRAKWLMEKKKVSACLFAEGTRSKTGEVQPFKRGAFHLASQIKYPIIPISISGTSKIMPKGKFKINPGTITVYFDKPIDTSNLNNKKDELEMMEKVRSIIIQKMEN